MRWTLLLYLPLTLSLPAAVQAETEPADDDSFSSWAYDVFVDGASVRLGLGVQQAGISVERKIDGAKGKIVQRRENSWFLSYSTKPTYFSIENTGLTFIFNVSGFDADQQEVSKDEFVDLGTRMSGRFYYFVPTVFYEWGSFESGIYARAGAGLGAGIARFNGDIILTSTASDEIISLQQSRTRITPATSFMLEANWYHWGVTLQFAGPNYQTDDYDITVEDASISLGYRLVF